MPEHLEAQVFADVGVEAMALGHVDRDLTLGLGHRLDHRHVLKEVDVAGFLVEARFELAVRAERRLRRLENRRLHRLDQNATIDAFLLRYLVDNHAESFGHTGCLSHFSPARTLRPTGFRPGARSAGARRLVALGMAGSGLEHEPRAFDDF